MKQTLIFVFLVTICFSANAAMTCNTGGNYCSNVVITKMMVLDTGQVFFKTQEQIPNTCSFYGYTLTIDMDNGTDADNPMFSSLMTFLGQRMKMDFQMVVSSAPGTSVADGCTATTLTRILNIRATFDPASFGQDAIVPAGDQLIP